MKALLYHMISDLDHRMAVPQEHFEEHLAVLTRAGYEFLALDDQLRETYPSDRVLSITFDDGYRNTVSAALPILRGYGIRASMAVCSDALRGLPLSGDWAKTDFLTTPELGPWLDAGGGLLAHSASHRRLPSCTDAELEDEVGGDHRTLRDLLGWAPTAFAYPYGAHDTRVVEAVGRVYGAAMTTTSHPNTGPDARLLLPRIEVERNYSGRELLEIVESR